MMISIRIMTKMIGMMKKRNFYRKKDEGAERRRPSVEEGEGRAGGGEKGRAGRKPGRYKSKRVKDEMKEDVKHRSMQRQETKNSENSLTALLTEYIVQLYLFFPHHQESL